MNERKSRLGVVVILIITLLCLFPLRSLKFEFNIEKLFPTNDPELSFFREFQGQFQSGIDDEFVFIGLKNKGGIFDRSFLTKTDSLTRYIARTDNIIKLYSITTANIIYFNKEEINARPLIHIDKPDLYPADSIYLFQSKEYRDLLVSRDGRSIAIAAFNKPNLTDDQKDNILNSIRDRMDSLGFDETHITAKIRVERMYIKEIQKNLGRYLFISLAFICISVYVLFRSLKTIVLPLLIIVVSIIWILSFISVTGNSLDILSSLLPPILAAICMSDIIHITTHYIEQLRSGLSKKEALNKTYSEIGLATFFTCCTVAAGFVTLGITDILPIRNFGFFTALGIFMAFGITMVALFAYYSHSPIPHVTFKKNADRQWNRFLAFLFKKIIKNKTIVFSLLIIVMGVSAYFTSKVEINSSLLQEIPKENPMLDDYRFMEKNFSGTRPFELVLSIKEKGASFFELDKMKQVEEVESFLKDSCGVGYLISPLSLIKGASKAFNGGENIHYVLPQTQQEVNRYYESITQTEFADVMTHYITSDGSRLRISGRLPNLSVKEFKPLKEKIDDYFSNMADRYYFSHHVTGSAVLLDKVTYSLTGNMFIGILFDALIICLIAFFLVRNWRIMIVVTVPNLVPLLIMSAAMGVMEINLKADTSVIFAISLGLAVDDTIHFLSRLRIELSKGLSVPYAVKRTYLSTGKAIIITTLVLLSGFMTLLSSSFGGTFYIGLLISLCLFSAMVLELTVTPLLILMLYKKRKRTS